MKTMLSRPLIAVTLVTLAAALAACGSTESDSANRAGEGDDGGSREEKVLGSSTKKGDFPATLAHATIDEPETIKVKVTPTPAARTAISWTVACRRGTKADTAAGQFNVRKPSTRRLKRPLKNSKSCEVSASAQMSKRGTIKLQIIG